MKAKNGKRRVLAGVVHLSLLCEVKIWDDDFKIEKTSKKLKRIQRQVAISVCSAYRTIPLDVVQIVVALVKRGVLRQIQIQN